jgi:hypothetical protein
MNFKAFTPDEGRLFAKRTKRSLFKYSNAGKAYSRVFLDRPVDIFVPGGINSFSDKYLSFTSSLSMKLFDNFKSSVTPNGFFDKHAISTNFQELNTVAGVKMKPIGYALIGNEKFRRDENLADGFVKDRHRKIFEEMMSVKYDGIDSEAIGKIARTSSSGFPMFSNQLEYKHQHFIFAANNIEKIFENVMKGKHRDNFENFGITGSGTANIRSQYDGFTHNSITGKFDPKVRYVNNIEYALSGGELGQRFSADKSVTIDGFTYPGKSSNRVREVNAKAAPYNNIGTAAIEGLRAYGESKYHMTWKHKGREDIESKISKYKLVLGLDVTNYDQSFPEWLFNEWLDNLPITDEFKAFTKMGMTAPSFYSSNGSLHDPLWTGDPFDDSFFNQYKGLPSGIFFTSMLGKDGFTFATLCAIDDITSDVLTNVDKILKHEHPVYAISNMGDDTLIHSNSQMLIDKLKLKNETTNFGMSEYFVVDVENGLKFLGNVGYEKEDGSIGLAGDLGTYLGNMLVPERSIGSFMREFGVYGLLERRGVYSDNPSFEGVDELFQKEFRSHFGINFFDLLNEHLLLPSSRNIHVKSAADLEVLLDPAKLHYKFDSSDISSDLLSTIESRMDRASVDKIIKYAIAM